MDVVIPPQERSAKRRFRPLRPGPIVLALLLLIVIGVVVSAFIQLPEEAIVPGQTMKVSSLIAVPSAKRQHHVGSISLVDVELVPLRAIDYLFYRWNHSDDVVPTSEIDGTETQAQYDEQGVLDMATAQQAATDVALRNLGYAANAKPSAVVVYQLETDNSTNFGVGEVILDVNGQRVSTLAQLQDRLSQTRPGQHLDLTTEMFASHTIHHVNVTLGVVDDVGKSTEHCAIARAHPPFQKGSGCIGIYVEQLYTTEHEPFKVGMNAEGITGPSAGLAFTLGLMQLLDRGDLTGGQKIAATGTMSINGAVGDVGGVAQKTIAVRNSGATVFFVPAVEYHVAKAEAGPRLKIVPVTNIKQVLSYLEDHGGKIVTVQAK